MVITKVIREYVTKTASVPLSVEPEFNADFCFVLNDKLGNIEELLRSVLKVLFYLSEIRPNRTICPLGIKKTDFKYSRAA